MPDTYWLIDRGTSKKVIPIDYTTQANPWPTPERGRTDTYDCRFVATPQTDYSTLSRDAVTGQFARYELVREYLKFPDRVSTQQVIGGTTVFHERDPPAALTPLDTHFVAIRPPDTLDVPDFYGVISGGSITKTATNSQYRLDLEIAYLGEVSDYTTRNAARQALEA